MNVFLYFSVVLIWGATWIAISFQHGELSPVVGVFWRFIIASSLLFIFLIITKKLKALSRQDHLFCLIQGACVFGFNFICFYTAIAYINSGLEAIIFSMAVIFNALNNRIFFGQKISQYFYPSAILGIAGIVALFWHDIVSTEVDLKTLWGIGLCLFGTYGFSIGNMVSIRHQKKGLDILTTNAFGMLYGAMIMGLIALFLQQDFFPQISNAGFFALLYLAVIGSVIGFTAYFALIGRIGASQAAYTTLLFPLVALSLSTIWENYQWHLGSILGVIFILLGNYILFAKPKRLLNALIKP
ncbi:multidrug DMT transporter permease [Acinetobacter sp. TGL-Y2]|uniref:DMT family transporter n=1 Tax=Acinetobacter sp. TGL-Y2 TaxID=1407071 RepID=UPI0007A67DAD|nr:DMT family transporter [Acinetobacter sp. TGL-Y2]AMW77541.1 multidrug DMT transporter permease [Acinetobacter sp. TGL-Y2]